MGGVYSNLSVRLLFIPNLANNNDLLRPNQCPELCSVDTTFSRAGFLPPALLSVDRAVAMARA